MGFDGAELKAVILVSNKKEIFQGLMIESLNKKSLRFLKNLGIFV